MSGVIKSLRNCPDGTDAFFKNVNPFISGGPGGNPDELQWDGIFVIDPEITIGLMCRVRHH